jgi:hypothetical protein
VRTDGEVCDPKAKVTRGEGRSQEPTLSSPATTTEQLDDPEMGSTWFYSIVGIIFFVVFCLVVSVLFFGVERDFTEERVIDEAPRLSTDLRTSQQSLLGQYGTYVEEVDEKKIERVRIPIERAMELMAKQGE